jgi:nucleoside-diphosphate-sugar epimerase
MRVLIVGCGYVGFSLAVELSKQGHQVWGLRRTSWTDHFEPLPGLVPLVADVTRPRTLTGLPGRYDAVIFSASATGGGVEEYKQIYLLGVQNVLEWLSAAPPGRMVYTSSTSVYGQTDGALVDETSPTQPVAQTARVLVQAESALISKASAHGIAPIILRLAGIYGPGRGYWLKQFLQGTATIEGEGGRVLNMIHRDDAVQAVMTALDRGRKGRIYNVVDDEPVTQAVCFQWLATRLRRDMPPAETEPAAVERKRGLTNKRVSNQRLRDELACELKYTTFREGFEQEIRRLGIEV